MLFLPKLDIQPATLLEWLRRALWWLLFGSLIVFLPLHAPVILHPERWIESGFRDLIVLLGWLSLCRALAIRWPRAAVAVCLLGLLPISALGLSAQADVIRGLDASPTTRILLSGSILFSLGLFARWLGVVAGTAIALLTLGHGGNTLQLLAGANVIFSIGMFGSLTRYVLDQLVQAHAKLERSALMDAMTGLGNRRALEADSPAFDGCWLTLWDMDDLKRVNDTLGHRAGDEYLLEFTRALSESLELHDRAYRTGGDEFVSLTRTAPEDMITSARRRFPSVSAGWARLERDLNAAMHDADTNLYQDKRSRKNLAANQIRRPENA